MTYCCLHTGCPFTSARRVDLVEHVHWTHHLDKRWQVPLWIGTVPRVAVADSGGEEDHA